MRQTSPDPVRESAPPNDAEFPGTSRFAIRRKIGEGAMGVVYEAFDRDRECRVALKTLRRGDAKSLYRFKREFRTLQDIEHPNLIRYGEMFYEADVWFFTMEFIDGVDFFQYARPAHPMPPLADGPAVGLERGFDEARLRDGMKQLATAIHTIHQLQILHRDIKPTNIRVTSRGRVVLLDFGLLTRQDPGEELPAGIVGTATYMSPEQAHSSTVGPASDWYSLGVVLYLMLTGRRPFRGKTPMEILMNKLEDDPLAPSEWVRDVPADLDDLCRRLMRSDPERRPHGAEVLRELGADPREVERWVESRAESVAAAFVGRSRELARISEDTRVVDDGEPLLTLLTSPAGMGKSELLRRFAQSGSQDGERLIVFGRCFERESLPYKAVDPLADQLALYLASLSDAARGPLTQSLGYWLTRLFPGFRRVSVLLREPSEFLSGLDPQVRRARMFRAFRELLWRIAARQRLVLVIDDLQWADSDSYLLLEELLRGPDAPALHLIVSWRTENEGAAREVAADLARRLPVRQRTIELGPLTAAEATELSTRLLSQSHRSDETVAEAIAARVGGHPLYIRELTRYVNRHGPRPEGLDVQEALAGRVAALPDDERRLLTLVALSSRPLTHPVLGYAARLPGGEYDRVVRVLRQEALVRPSESVSGALEVYHERVAGAVRRQLLDEERRSTHAAIAAALERSSGEGGSRTRCCSTWPRLASASVPQRWPSSRPPAPPRPGPSTRRSSCSARRSTWPTSIAAVCDRFNSRSPKRSFALDEDPRRRRRFSTPSMGPMLRRGSTVRRRRQSST